MKQDKMIAWLLGIGLIFMFMVFGNLYYQKHKTQEDISTTQKEFYIDIDGITYVPELWDPEYGHMEDLSGKPLEGNVPEYFNHIEFNDITFPEDGVVSKYYTALLAYIVNDFSIIPDAILENYYVEPLCEYLRYSVDYELLATLDTDEQPYYNTIEVETLIPDRYYKVTQSSSYTGDFYFIIEDGKVCPLSSARVFGLDVSDIDDFRNQN